MLVGWRRGPVEVVVRLAARPGATVADLAAALGAPGDGLLVDGRPFPGPTLLAATGIHPGSRLHPLPSPLLPGAGFGSPSPGWPVPGRSDGGGGSVLPPAAAAELRVVGGPCAGHRIPLPAGRWLVGRRAPAEVVVEHPTVSAAHLVLEVAADGSAAVADAGSRNGTRVDGRWATAPVALDAGAVVAAGAVRLAVVPPTGAPAARLGPPGADGRRPFHRPPRPPVPPPHRPVDRPEVPPAPRATTRLHVTALVAPLVLGLVVAVVFRHPAMALLALLGPVTVGGAWLEDRRRAGREARRRGEAVAAADAEFGRRVAEAAAAEARRRRAAHPDPAALAARAEAADARLWERRPPAADLLAVTVGHGGATWSGVDLDDVPVVADLAVTALGVAGPRPAALAVARSLACQVATVAGPAHARLAVLTDTAGAPDWAWTVWLPHLLAPPAAAPGVRAGLVARLLAAPPGGPATVVVVDGEAAADDARPLLAGGRAAVVVAPAPERLPAGCTAVLAVDADGRGHLDGDPLTPTGVPAGVAARWARSLAALADPEEGGGAGLPAAVGLLEVVGLDDPTPEALAARWRSASGRLAATLGATAAGPLTVDLVADGPHALVAGTTGSGKSELLRTLVASLAATVGPDELNVVLLDYKGGSAFDRCADLPHVAGVVTDLDEHLGHRALVCLEAELRERERRLREVGAADLAAYRSTPGAPPLPRLLVVVDEFAAMAAELPAFVDALVGVAQRGRSLGLHLVLATQRPSGVVSEAIRANTNLRVALRVQDRAESVDVVGAPDAAGIARHQPGRAVARLGPGELVAFQAALATGTAPAAAGPVTVRAAGVEPPAAVGEGPTDLGRLVGAARSAAAALGLAPPRRPWPDPLPAEVALDRLPAGAVGLVDEPDRQRVVPLGLGEHGHLLVLGVPGAGATTTLAAVALALARSAPPDRLHLAVLDCGSGALVPLAGLPHVGAVVGPAEDERRARLLRMVRDEVDRRRRGDGPAGARLVLLVDGYGALRAACDGLAGLELLDGLTRVLADGPSVGVTAVVTAESPAAVPSAVASLAADRLVLRLADPVAWAAAGVPPRAVPPLPPGRGIHLPSGRLVQVAVPGRPLRDAVADAAALWPPVDPACRAPAVATLPDDVPLASLGATAEAGPGGWRLPVGLADRDLGPAWLALDEGEHALVAGPPRSGRSTALAALGAAAADVPVTAVALRRSPLRSSLPAARLVTDRAGLGAALDAVAGPHLVLVDDADAVEDPGGRLADLLAGERPGVHVVAAARVDAVRRSGTWLAGLRRASAGVALRPDLDADPDLWAAALPRRPRLRPAPGRGYLVSGGTAELVQVARP